MLQNGILTAHKSGTTVLKTSMTVATVDMDGKSAPSEVSNLVTINVENPGYDFTLVHTSKYTIFALMPNEIDSKKRSVTVNGKKTDMIYDAANNTHLCAFNGIVSFTDIKAGLSSGTDNAMLLVSGDSNGDRTVGYDDITEIVHTYLNGFNWNDSDPNRIIRIDLNGDGVVNVLDALIAAKKVKGEN